MPSPRPHRNGGNDVRVTEKSMSFHGRDRDRDTTVAELRRPRTVPDLISATRNNNGVLVVANHATTTTTEKKKLTKVLLNVTVQGCVGAVQVLISPDLNVRDLISAALKQYLKEGRRPVILNPAVDQFDLHYSQFSLESLDREEKIAELGSRNFFLCKRKVVVDGGANGGVSTSSCLKQAEKAAKLVSPCPWVKFINFLF